MKNQSPEKRIKEIEKRDTEELTALQEERERWLIFPFTGKLRVLHDDGAEEWMEIDDFKRALRSGNDID